MTVDEKPFTVALLVTLYFAAVLVTGFFIFIDVPVLIIEGHVVCLSKFGGMPFCLFLGALVIIFLGPPIFIQCKKAQQEAKKEA